MSIIYRITNTINGKSYIGQTIFSLERRWQGHCTCAKKKLDKSIYFYKALRKYGIDCWELEVLEEVDNKEMLSEREKYWVAYYDTFNKQKGYNSTSGGDNGYTISDETREKMSRAKKGTPTTASKSSEAKEKISKSRLGKNNPMFGKPSPFTGRHHTEESKEKLRQAALKQWHK